ncbi:MAG TPA: cache domain-containing protein, partial [Thermoanaerobaculia bacterium]
MPKMRAPRTKLVWTLVGILVLVGILPLIVSHYFLIGINRESLETLEKQYLTRSAVGVATQIEAMVSSYRQQLAKIAGGVALSAQSSAGDPFQLADESGLVASYVASDPDLVGLRVVSASGIGSTAQPAQLGAAIEDELDRGFQLALKRSEYVGSFQNLPSSNQPVIVIAVPIVESDGDVLGAVEALVSLGRIAVRLREESRGDVTAFVIDGSGRVLMHSEPAIALQRPDYSGLPIVAEFMKAREVRLIQTYGDPYAP